MRIESKHTTVVAPSTRLSELRRVRRHTQAQLGKTLGVSQAQVSRIETQTDLRLSTLAAYLHAMGGRLQLVATFEEGTQTSLLIQDATHTPR